MPTEFTGGCVCGAVRYECSADCVVSGGTAIKARLARRNVVSCLFGLLLVVACGTTTLVT
jgi:hypothetical protein